MKKEHCILYMILYEESTLFYICIYSTFIKYKKPCILVTLKHIFILYSTTMNLVVHERNAVSTRYIFTILKDNILQFVCNNILPRIAGCLLFPVRR